MRYQPLRVNIEYNYSETTAVTVGGGCVIVDGGRVIVGTSVLGNIIVSLL